ncbi:MAG: HAD family phosphatase [Synergistaceae bacterium]|nr:HAD family phosphatase [Synergistaceae bacterium]
MAEDLIEEKKKKEKKKIETVIFDMDGLMFDTEALYLRGWTVAGRKHGFDISGEYARSCVGLHKDINKIRMTEHFGEGFDFDAVRNDRVAWVFDYIEKNGTPVKKGLRELLAFLKDKGVRTALGSCSLEDQVKFSLKHAHLNHDFDVVVCGGGLKGKPDPAIYLQVLSELKTGPEKCLVLEDTPYGVLAAYRAGIRSIILTPDIVPPTPETEKLIAAKVDSLLDVIPIITEWNGY